MEEQKKCPGCERSCELSEPRCGRGKEYAKTGVLPQGPEKKGHPNRLRFEKKEQQLIMKYLHHAVGIADNGGLTQEMTGKMFEVLTEEETTELMKLLEKLSDHWISMAPERRG